MPVIRTSWRKSVVISGVAALFLGLTYIVIMPSVPSASSASVQSLSACYDGQDINNLQLDTRIYGCLMDTITAITAREGYAHANEALGEVFAVMYRTTGRYCAQVNEAMVLAAMDNGESYLDIVNTHNSLCTFAIVHAIGQYAAEEQYPADTVAIVAEVCSMGGLLILNQETYSSQCWHGAGYGIERVSKNDIDLSTRMCESAPNPGWAQNCYEGIYEFLRHSLWMQESKVRASYESILNSCSEKSFSNLRAMACYKDTSISLTADNMYYNEVRSVVPLYLKVCLNERRGAGQVTVDSVRLACTIGYGMYVALVAAATDNKADYKYTDALKACDDVVVFVRECYFRATQTLAKTPLRPDGVPLANILALTPVEIRDWLNDTYTEYMGMQSGRSTNESY